MLTKKRKELGFLFFYATHYFSSIVPLTKDEKRRKFFGCFSYDSYAFYSFSNLLCYSSLMSSIIKNDGYLGLLALYYSEMAS
jgi:hypothetical protein